MSDMDATEKDWQAARQALARFDGTGVAPGSAQEPTSAWARVNAAVALAIAMAREEGIREERERCNAKLAAVGLYFDRNDEEAPLRCTDCHSLVAEDCYGGCGK